MRAEMGTRLFYLLITSIDTSILINKRTSMSVITNTNKLASILKYEYEYENVKLVLAFINFCVLLAIPRSKKNNLFF